MHKRIIILLTLLSLAPFTGMAQADDMTCPEKLSEARRRFENGRFYSIPKLLEECVRKGLNDQQRMEAYYLLSQTYLFIDEPEKAEEAYLSILRIDPEFKPDNERAPIDQVYLSEKFTTRPIFIVNGRLGVNYTSVDVIEQESTSPVPFVGDYNVGIGFEGGAGLDIVFSNFVSIGSELNLVQKKYSYSEDRFDGDTYYLTDTQWSLDIPLYVRFYLKTGKISPFLYGGGSYNLIFSSNADLEMIDRQNRGQNSESDTEVSVTGPSLSMMDQRSTSTFNIVFGGGVRIKSGYDQIQIDLRYRGGLNDMVNSETQWQNQPAVFRYTHVDDHLRLNNLVLSVGYVKPFYKPRKKRKYRK